MESPTSELEQFRRMKDELFSHDPHSPLTREQKRLFKGLSYFPPSPELRFELELEPFTEQQQIEMQTSTGDIQTFHRLGQVQFEAEGQPARLTVFANENGYFLPFVDSQSGIQTYPAGRYLEPELLSDGRLLVDFNLAYNPYCAYNERWSCPLTPFENRLKIPIRAGEKLPDSDWTAHE